MEILRQHGKILSGGFGESLSIVIRIDGLLAFRRIKGVDVQFEP